MLEIPYISSPKNACALACYAMTAKYFFPKTTFNQIAKMSDWKKGKVVWPFKFWLWIMDKGIKVIDFDTIDYPGWANEGLKGLQQSISKKEFDWLVKNSDDLNILGKQINKVLNHKNFTHKKEKPKLDDLTLAVASGKICEVIVDSHTLDNIPGFALHRVVVTGIKDNHIYFHDPREIPKPNRKETVKHFVKSWLGAVEDPELCIYQR